MNNLIPLAILGLACAASVAADATGSATANPLAASRSWAASNNAFGFDLYAQLRGRPGNLVSGGVR